MPKINTSNLMVISKFLEILLTIGFCCVCNMGEDAAVSNCPRTSQSIPFSKEHHRLSSLSSSD